MFQVISPPEENKMAVANLKEEPLHVKPVYICTTMFEDILVGRFPALT